MGKTLRASADRTKHDQTCNIQLNIPAHTMMEGNSEFLKKLLPPGAKVIVHKTPNRRRTWVHNGVQGWYIGPAVEHYRCYDV